MRGTVVVNVDPALQGGHAHLAGAHIAVRLLVRGVEGGKGDEIEIIAFVSTVIGPLGSGEAAHAAAVLRDVMDFTAREARDYPLPGEAMCPVHDNVGHSSYTADGSGDSDGYISKEECAAASKGCSSGDDLPATATVASLPPQRTTVTVPQDWKPGGHYECRFSFHLPPWLSPCHYYKPTEERWR